MNPSTRQAKGLVVLTILHIFGQNEKKKKKVLKYSILPFSTAASFDCLDSSMSAEFKHGKHSQNRMIMILTITAKCI